MLRTVSWLALPGRTLSAGFDGGISPPFQFVAAQLLGGWVPTETGLSPASHSRLLWTHNSSALRHALLSLPNETARFLHRTLAELCQHVGPDHERMTSRVGAGREHVPGPEGLPECGPPVRMAGAPA